MSIYRRAGQSAYSYDFWLDGVRFTGGTGTADRREAQRHEREVARPAAAREIARRAAGDAALSGAALTLAQACARWFSEVAEHRPGADTALRDIERLCGIIGGDREFSGVTGSDLARAIAARRGHTRWGKAKDRMISPATVNRSVTRRLQAVAGRAARAWGVDAPKIDWRAHLLPEATPRPRPLAEDLRAAILAELPEGYRALAAFAQASGLRLAECFIRWSDVDEAAGCIHYVGKGRRPGRALITPLIRAIIDSCPREGEFVFTFVARRRGGKAGRDIELGRRYPVRYEGMKSAFIRAVARVAERDGRAQGVTFHKQRHARGIDILLRSGSLKAAQRALNHASIATTATFYADYSDDDLRAILSGVDEAGGAASPQQVPRKVPQAGGR